MQHQWRLLAQRDSGSVAQLAALVRLKDVLIVKDLDLACMLC